MGELGERKEHVFSPTTDAHAHACARGKTLTTSTFSPSLLETTTTLSLPRSPPSTPQTAYRQISWSGTAASSPPAGKTRTRSFVSRERSKHFRLPTASTTASSASQSFAPWTPSSPARSRRAFRGNPWCLRSSRRAWPECTRGRIAFGFLKKAGFEFKRSLLVDTADFRFSVRFCFCFFRKNFPLLLRVVFFDAIFLFSRITSRVFSLFFLSHLSHEAPFQRGA